MNHYFPNLLRLLLVMIVSLTAACSDDCHPLVSGVADYAEGEIYDKTDGDSDGSKGKMNYNGYTYEVVRIVTQWWMAENLRTTRYNDVSLISQVTDDDEWSDLTTGAWCDYDNDPANGAVYGKLYNWFAVNTGKLAPPGWHVPAGTEWETLSTFLGGSLSAGKLLKESGTAHWKSPNSGSNMSGFTALGGGGRFDFGSFYSLLDNAFFWTSSPSGSANAGYYALSYDGNRFVGDVDDRSAGYSVRCVQD
ncbi:MAG: fibrobacter succinogenes major paralogous domain-containing protein [Chlorobium sp.]|nr:fibrobacter succinogenes major paralogous domain-containing protein [Chlorobium sp.]MCW8819416.1 fibrobacter succinogenes major paralogous domain-containing protein [Ignavibacteriaceae bacterium]